MPDEIIHDVEGFGVGSDVTVENTVNPWVSELPTTSNACANENGKETHEKSENKGEPGGDKRKRVIGPLRSKNNRSSGMRKGALDYLQSKEERDRKVKEKELELAERKLELEERKMRLDERRLELDHIERQERWQIEQEKIKQELFERNQSCKIIEYQQRIIESLTEQLKKYSDRENGH